MAELNIGYEALVSCHEKLIFEIAQDPKQMAITLFQHRFISEDTKAKINELDRTRRDKAILLVDNIESKVKCYPEFYEKFLFILCEFQNELLYRDLVKSLQEEYERIEAESKDGYESCPLSLLQPLPMPSWVAMGDETESGILELPSVDDRETLPDPLEHPPDVAKVGADLRAAATSQQEAPTVDSFEGQLLQTFRIEEFEQAIELLSQAEIDLRGVSDADGKTLLHLACRNGGVDWKSIVCSLVNRHNCNVAVVDEDGNTPLHEAYQCGNRLSLEYLLSLPTCNPDAINKHEYTVLRMALEVNDKTTVRDLLASGKVDPRKGSSRGHTYSELLAMNQLQPQPQDYDGSALQMVIQFAECMEGSNHVRPPFTSYCLRDTLRKILKHRDQVSITGLVDRIKDNLLPLPANPDDLLIDIQSVSDEFAICGEYTKEFGGFQIRKSLVVDKNTANISECDEGMELVPIPSEVPVPAINDPSNDIEEGRSDYNIDISDLVPILPPSSIQKVQRLTKREIKKPNKMQTKRKNKEPKEKLTYKLCLYCCSLIGMVGLILFSILLGILGSLLYDGYSLVGTTNVAQIHPQSVPLIGTLDNPSTFDSLRFSEPTNGTDFVPISFYTLRNCSSKYSFINVEINETITVNFDSPTDKSKAVTEWYLGNTTLTLRITTEVVSNYLTDYCIAFFFVFDDFNKFLNFTLSSSLVADFYYKGCITNQKSQMMNITFDKPSYYYIGVYTDIPTEVGAFSLHFLGTYLQYNISKGNAVCTINSLDALSCDFSLNTNQQLQTCIVGSVPPSTMLSGIKRTTVDFYTAVNSRAKITIYFFLPIIFILIFLILIYCNYRILQRYKESK